ncbi:MAG: S8 family serine peptidase, partial [Nanoarchaeota archaeon]|nr:S8 family serine peptidase [Nanoarchaeota archaeon]
TTLIFSAILFFITLAMLSPIHAAEQHDLKKNEIGALFEKASASPDGTVQVIMKMKGAPQKNTKLTTAANAANPEAPEKLGALLNSKRILKRGDSDFFAANVSLQDLQALASDSRVESISEDRKMHAFLSDSVPLISANSVWAKQIEGTNITGAGTSVCIIDTGVDYTHPDLGGCTSESFLSGNCSKVIGGYDFANNDGNPMDDHGHGTHIAGIVAANGSLKGVAPDAKIVAIKVLDSSGSGSESDVALGIDWCIANSAKFNITAISMSLGGDVTYPKYCDNAGADNLLLAEAINSAAAENISVVIATGNRGIATGYSGVSSPACIENATRVTATEKSGNYASFAERGIGFPDILAAPGVSITSTYLNSGQRAMDGTSMSTPHVSGAIALISQAYQKLYRTLQTPQYFKSLLNATGKQINDTVGAKINFSRIDVFSAYNALVALTITISSPENGTFLNTNNARIIASQNAISWMNYSIDDGGNISACQNCNNFENYSASLTDGLHNLTVYGNNSAVALAHATVWFTTDTIPPEIYFSDACDANNSFLDKQWIFANLSINETNFANATFFLFNSSELVNSTTTADESALFVNWTASSEGEYYFTATVFDKAGNSNSIETRKIAVDLAPPEITAITFSPTYVHTGQNITITYSITDLSSVKSEIFIAHHNISESINQSHSGEKYTAVFTNVSNSGEYKIMIFAKDAVNHTSNASEQFFANASSILLLNSSGDETITLLIKRENTEIGKLYALSEEKNKSFDSGNYAIEAHGKNETFTIILSDIEFIQNEILKIFFSNVTATSPNTTRYRFTENAFSFSPDFNISSATVCLNYTYHANGFQNISRAKNFRCAGLCENGNWSMLETLVNTTTNQSCSNISSFSSFVLGELLPYCDDGNIDSGETCASCPADAGACPAPAKHEIQKSGGGGWGGGIIIKAKNITNATNASVSFKTSDKNTSMMQNISSKAKDNASIIKDNNSEINAPEIKTKLEENENVSENREPIIATGHYILNYLNPITSFIDWLIHSLMLLF